MGRPPTEPHVPGPEESGVPPGDGDARAQDRTTGQSPAGQSPTSPPPEEAPADELARLRAEVEALHAQLDVRRRRARAITTARRVTAALLVALAAFACVASVVGLWAGTTVLSTDRWVSTVAPLPANPQVSSAVAEYSTTQVFQVLDVEQRVREVLPDQAAFVAVPITGQLREYLTNTVTAALRSDRFQPIWQEVNRRFHQQALAVLQGRSEVATVQGEQVQIDLLPIINQVLRELSAQLPTLFGRTITLPDLSSGAIPDDLRARVAEALGVTLPANFAQFTVYEGERLRVLQDALVTFRRSIVLLVVSALVLLGLALLVAPQRRRTILQFGIWLVIAAVTVTAILRAVRTQLLMQVPAGTYRDGTAAAVTIVTSILRDRGIQLLWLGTLIALIAYLVGPGRVPLWLRSRVVAAARGTVHATRRGTHLLVEHGPSWADRHRDPLRIAGVVVAVLLALAFSSWTALIVLAILLAVYEVAVTVVAQAAGEPAELPGEPSEAPAATAGKAG
jgi:hypothetical protein